MACRGIPSRWPFASHSRSWWPSPSSFAVSGGTARTAGIILGLLGAVIVVQIMASAVGMGLDIVSVMQAGFLTWPGPLAIFTGRWMLIDV